MSNGHVSGLFCKFEVYRFLRMHGDIYHISSTCESKLTSCMKFVRRCVEMSKHDAIVLCGGHCLFLPLHIAVAAVGL